MPCGPKMRSIDSQRFLSNRRFDPDPCPFLDACAGGATFIRILEILYEVTVPRELRREVLPKSSGIVDTPPAAHVLPVNRAA